MARTVDVIGDRWSLLIVRDVFDGIQRFGALQRNLGLAKNILASRLRDLVGNGILQIVSASDGTAYHQYQLTDKGHDLFIVIVALRQWGEDHLFDDGEAHSVLLDTDHEMPLRRLQVTDAQGDPVGPAEAFVRKVEPRAT